jgi:putative membrane protein
MSVSMIVFWGLVIWAVVALARRPASGQIPGVDPRRILQERFAIGEIDEDEYRRRREVLDPADGRAGLGSEHRR